MAYTRQADRIWIVNVGDLKPLEIPINHFMDLAYDTPAWDYDSVPAWSEAWATREFGADFASNISSVVDRYGLYANRRKYELIDPTVYSVINYNEAEAVLAQWAALAADAQAIYDKLDAASQPAFFEMVLQPALGGQIVNQVHIGAAKNIHYVEQKRNAANDIAMDVIASFKDDATLTQQYHDLLDGKWNHMLDQTHFGYDYWQQPMRNALPPLGFVQDLQTSAAGNLAVGVEASNATVSGDDVYHALSSETLALPPMDPYGPKTRWIDIFSRGTEACSWFIATPSYVTASPSSGTTGGTNGTDIRIYLSVDWSAAPLSTTALLNITTPCGWGSFSAPHVQLPISNTAVPSSFTGFVESDLHIAIEAEHASCNSSSDTASFLTIPNLGRTLSGVLLQPVTAPSQDTNSGPVLEYDIYTFNPTKLANLTLYLSPSLNNLSPSRPLRYAVAFDESTPQIVQPVIEIPTALAGADLPEGWAGAVADGVWGLSSGKSTTTTHDLTSTGAHTLKIWLLEPGLVLQKVVLDLGGVRTSYLGPPESFLVGRDTVGEYGGLDFRG